MIIAVSIGPRSVKTVYWADLAAVQKDLRRAEDFLAQRPERHELFCSFYKALKSGESLGYLKTMARGPLRAWTSFGRPYATGAWDSFKSLVYARPRRLFKLQPLWRRLLKSRKIRHSQPNKGGFMAEKETKISKTVAARGGLLASLYGWRNMQWFKPYLLRPP